MKGNSKVFCFTFSSINAIFKHVTYFLYVINGVLFDYEKKGHTNDEHFH